MSDVDPVKDNNSCRSFTGKVCADPGQKSCAGFGSCIEATIGEVVDGCDAPNFPIFLGNGVQNNQINACRGSTIDKVINSCHGQKSCFEVVKAGRIENSCIGDYSCFHLAWGGGQYGTDVEVIVDDVLHSCIGSYACSSFAGYGLAGQHHIPVPAHVTRIAYSCRGSHACHELPGSPITEANGSCNTNNACDKYDSDDVESVLVCKCPTSSQYTHRQKCVDAGYGNPENVPADRCIDPAGELSICRGEGVCGLSADGLATDITCVVSNTNDGPEPGSLRHCINEVNAGGGGEGSISLVTFDGLPLGDHQIALSDPLGDGVLLDIVQPIVLDAIGHDRKITLIPSGWGTVKKRRDIVIGPRADGSVVRGLHFFGMTLRISRDPLTPTNNPDYYEVSPANTDSADGVVISNNVIGGRYNEGPGIEVQGLYANIHDNVISGCQNGIMVHYGGDKVSIRNNEIHDNAGDGIDPSKTTAGHGIFLYDDIWDGYPASANDEARALISENSVYDNIGNEIYSFPKRPFMLRPPIFLSLACSDGIVSGTIRIHMADSGTALKVPADTDYTIELFSEEEKGKKIYITSVSGRSLQQVPADDRMEVAFSYNGCIPGEFLVASITIFPKDGDKWPLTSGYGAQGSVSRWQPDRGACSCASTRWSCDPGETMCPGLGCKSLDGKHGGAITYVLEKLFARLSHLSMCVPPLFTRKMIPTHVALVVTNALNIVVLLLT